MRHVSKLGGDVISAEAFSEVLFLTADVPAVWEEKTGGVDIFNNRFSAVPVTPGESVVNLQTPVIHYDDSASEIAMFFFEVPYFRA